MTEPWQAAVAVRRDWPDGTHEFVHLGVSHVEAEGFAANDEAYWRRGPWRPAHAVVRISARDFDLHRRRRLCRAPDCPTVSPS